MTDRAPVPVVIGTAGHIDHGKSALVEALCGTHPDRWQEERERGITLDLGYAQLELPDGLEIGFVDVPGHEKLVRKMVAGATGVGAAMLVVACDDGVMPQTREHFEVLQLLGVDRGLVALSKADLADEETVELVREDVAVLLAGSSWEGAPTHVVSAHAGTGLDELRAGLRELALAARTEADARRAFRLPVQRSFKLSGAGTVATGVTAAGEVRTGDVVLALPARKRSRVRRVQVHGRATDTGRAGLRTALNLPELDPEDVPRGAVLVAPGTGQAGRLLRMSVRSLDGAPALEHAAEVLVLTGTAAVLGRAFFDEREDDEERFVDVELGEPMALAPGDRCLLRRPSPAVNLGLGRFLGYGERRLRRRDRRERAFWKEARAVLDDPPALLAQLLELDHGRPKRAADLAEVLGWTGAATAEALAALVEEGRAQRVGSDHFVGTSSAAGLVAEVEGVLAHFRAKHPGAVRIPIQRFRDRVGRDGWRILERMPDEQLAAMGVRRRRGERWEMLGVEVDEAIRADAARLAERLDAGGMAPPSWEEIVAASGLDAAAAEEARRYLVDSGAAVAPAEGVLLSARVVEEFRAAVVEQLQGGGMDIPALRDRFGTTRKYVMPVLEYLDDCGVTERRGPNRLLRDPAAPIS